MGSNFYFWLRTFQYHGSCIGSGSKLPSFYSPDATHIENFFMFVVQNDFLSPKEKTKTHIFLQKVGQWSTKVIFANFWTHQFSRKTWSYHATVGGLEYFWNFHPDFFWEFWSNLTNAHIFWNGLVKNHQPACWLRTKSRHCGSLTIRMPAGAVGHGGREGGPRGLGESCSTWISGGWFQSKKSPTGPTVHGPRKNLIIS